MTRPPKLSRAARQLAVGWLHRASWLMRQPVLPPDLDPELEAIVRRVRPFTMTTPRRIAALCDAVEHVVRRELPGAIAECGVWRGGSMMAVALTLQRLGRTDRDLYLFDTFRGMPAPTAEDTRSLYDGYSPVKHWRRRQRGDLNTWHYVPAERVRETLLTTGYPAGRIHLVEGRVEETIPSQAPGELALLRLDTDWYASTRHEIEHLYPRLRPGGVLLIDDYGHYEGARRAVDEYLAERGEVLLLNRIDYTGRLAVKPERA